MMNDERRSSSLRADQWSARRLPELDTCAVHAGRSRATPSRVPMRRQGAPSWRGTVLSRFPWRRSSSRSASRPHSRPQQLPPISANDNRVTAGALKDGVLTLRLEMRKGIWHPESDDGEAIPVYAFGEAGKPLQVPGPAIRVPQGTTIDITLRNDLAVPATLHGCTSGRARTTTWWRWRQVRPSTSASWQARRARTSTTAARRTGFAGTNASTTRCWAARWWWIPRARRPRTASSCSNAGTAPRARPSTGSRGHSRNGWTTPWASGSAGRSSTPRT